MDYSNYEIQDFVSDESFVQWVINGSPEATRFWENYRTTHPAQRQDIDEAREFLITLRKAEHALHTPEKVSRIWKNIEDGISGNTQHLRRRKQSLLLLGIAASFLVVALGIVSWYTLRPKTDFDNGSQEEISSAKDKEFVEEVNNTGDVIRIHLSDGSVVELHDKSRLRYRKNHTAYSHREVYLTGEAFFDIAKNPKQPFLVYTNEVVTKVLGTSFRIKAYESDEDITVAVKEGKVSVYSARENVTGDSIVSEVNGVVLTPNQQVVYARTEDMFVKTLISNPEVIEDAIVESLFVFENTPAMEVFRVLESAYGVEIIADEEMMSNCFLTVRLVNEPLFEQLKIVCRTIGAKYELMDAKIIIDGKGCF